MTKVVIRAISNDFDIFIATIDIDHFRKVNDTDRHDIGDEVIRRVAR